MLPKALRSCGARSRRRRLSRKRQTQTMKLSGSRGGVQVWAPAKLNLALAITGKRDGYHLLDTIFQEIGLVDRIEIRPAESTRVLVETGEVLPRDNTIKRAVNIYYDTSALTGGAEVRVWKHIPSQAGLGGGSSDAAAVLLGLNRLHGGLIPETRLAELALEIGADCPFFLRGGTQRARGIGEKLTPIPNRCRLPLLLVKPAAGVPTGPAFAIADSLPPVAVDIEACLQALACGDAEAYFAAAGNALQPAAIHMVPEIAVLGERCRELGASFWLLTGSGSCVFAAFPSAEERDRAADVLEQDGDLFVHAAELGS